MTFELNAPARPRLPVINRIAARFGLPDGWRSSGNRSARSGEYSPAITSPSALAYGRAPTTRSWARFIFDVATISIVRVILRVFSTDLMRPLSSRPLAIRLLVRFDAAAQVGFHILAQFLLGADRVANLGILRLHEVVEAALPFVQLRRIDVVEEAVGHGEDDHDLLIDRHRLILPLLQHFHRACPALQLSFGGGIEIGCE